MTTAHRPTFDQARARSGGPQTSIQHKRALPGYKTLKYRKKAKKVNDDFDSDEDEEEEFGVDGKLRGYITSKDVKSLRETLLLEEKRAKGEASLGEVKDEIKEVSQTSGKHKDEDLKQESGDEGDDSSDESNSSSTDESSSDDDEEEEEEELLRELENIRKEKETKAKDEHESVDNTQELIREPIPDTENKKADTIRKSWRSQSLFHLQKRQSDQEKHNPMINNMMQNDFHKRFMDSYFK